MGDAYYLGLVFALNDEAVNSLATEMISLAGEISVIFSLFHDDNILKAVLRNCNNLVANLTNIYIQLRIHRNMKLNGCLNLKKTTHCQAVLGYLVLLA